MITSSQITLIMRPEDVPKETDFSAIETDIGDPEDGELLIKTEYLSIDPYIRAILRYEELGQVINGIGIGTVLKSRDQCFKEGDFIRSIMSWSEYSIVKASVAEKIDLPSETVTYSLGALGLTGMAAYFGLHEIGKPVEGETVVVSAAAGGVGLLAGQLALIKGCNVVGIAGSEKKVRYLKELGFDYAVNYKSDNWIDSLRSFCTRGVDVYFDNVGGHITEQVLQQLNKNARVVVCGQISFYNSDEEPFGKREFPLLLVKGAVAQGVMIKNYTEKYGYALDEIKRWIGEGKIKIKEDILYGLENAPKALIGLFSGNNIGKQLVKV